MTEPIRDWASQADSADNWAYVIAAPGGGAEISIYEGADGTQMATTFLDKYEVAQLIEFLDHEC